MAFPLAAVPVAIGIGKQLFKKKRKTDIGPAVARLRASTPVGYLTPEDMRAAEVSRGRITEGIQKQGQLAGYEIGRRYRARGLAGSPSEERSRARLDQETLLGAEHAGDTAEEQLYNIRTGREAYQRQKDLAIFGAEVGQANREYDRQQAETASFWNSLNEFVPTILSGIGPTSAPSSVPGGPLGPPASGAAVPNVRGYTPERRPDEF